LKIAALGNEGNDIIIRKLSLLSESLKKFVDSLTKDDYIAVEASTNTFWFVDLVREKIKECFVVNPYKFDIISRSVVKTDKRDAVKLVRNLRYYVLHGGTEDELPTVYIPSKEVQILRSYFTTYCLLNKEVIMIKNRIHALLKQNGVFGIKKRTLFNIKVRKILEEMNMREDIKIQIKVLYDTADYLINEKEKIKIEILKQSKIFDKEIDILISIPGISVFAAIAIMSDVADIKRFNSAKKFCSYLRCAPKVDSSNRTIKIGKINKQSRTLTLNVLTESVTHFVESSRRLTNFYERKSIGKSKGKVRIAIIRKILVSIYHMLSNEKYYYDMNERNYMTKKREYENILKKVA
jgi:transposase